MDLDAAESLDASQSFAALIPLSVLRPRFAAAYSVSPHQQVLRTVGFVEWQADQSAPFLKAYRLVVDLYMW